MRPNSFQVSWMQIVSLREARYFLREHHTSTEITCGMARTTKPISFRVHIPMATSSSGASCRRTTGKLKPLVRSLSFALTHPIVWAILSVSRPSPSGIVLLNCNHLWTAPRQKFLLHLQVCGHPGKEVHGLREDSAKEVEPSYTTMELVGLASKLDSGWQCMPSDLRRKTCAMS